MLRPAAPLIASILMAACQSTSDEGGHAETSSLQESTGSRMVQYWGGMRDVLRNGNTQGRVKLADVVGPGTIAVGALEGLGAEITIIDGETQLAEVNFSDLSKGLRVRSHTADDKATLLVLADVPHWTEQTLDPASDISALEAAIRSLALAQGLDVTQPFPFRIEGIATELHLHVLNHSCPIANPEGPAPWRFEGTGIPVTLVGFLAHDAAGVLTHHGQSSHIHAVLKGREVSGHVDAIQFDRPTRLYLPTN